MKLLLNEVLSFSLGVPLPRMNSPLLPLVSADWVIRGCTEAVHASPQRDTGNDDPKGGLSPDEAWMRRRRW